MATRPVCLLCSATREVTYDGMTVECPFHDGAELVQMAPATADRMWANLLDHANRHPEETGPEPTSFAESSDDALASSRMLGGLLIALSVVVMVALIVALVILW